MSSRQRKDLPADPLDVHIGIRLRQRRNLLGLTQGDLASKLDVKYQQIQKYERGQNRIAASTLFALAHILQIPVTYFYEEFADDYEQGDEFDYATGFAESGQVPFEGEDPLLRRETMNLIRAYYSIENPKKRKKVYELVRSMADMDSDGV